MKEKQEGLITVTTLAPVQPFNEAFNRQDIEATMATMTEACLFENTYPSPDGAPYQGQAAVRAAFATFFRSSPQAKFQIEEIFAAKDRAIVRWVYHGIAQTNQAGHIRGLALFRLRDDKVAEKLSYVKG